MPRGLLDICHRKINQESGCNSNDMDCKIEYRRQSDGAPLGEEISQSSAMHIINEHYEKLKANPDK